VDERKQTGYGIANRMDLLHQLFQQIRDLRGLLTWGGYPVLMAIVFAETGLLVGFFLPGDSLLVTAGVLVNANMINPLEISPPVNLVLMNIFLILTAIAGDAVGFWFGLKTGPRIFRKEQSFFFRKDRLLATKAFYDRHGGKTIVLARFMPFARTFAPIIAGIGQMPYKRFALFNVVGGTLWVSSMTCIGYFLGKIFDAKSIEKIVYLIILLSLTPPVIGYLKQRFGSSSKSGSVKDEMETSDITLSTQARSA